MEQITRRDGVVYYGEQPCYDINDAYSRFRRDYHDSLGRQVYKRLDRIGQRTERIHGYGFCFEDGVLRGREEFGIAKKVPYRMSLVVICYCRIIGINDLPDITDEQFERWFDWAFTKGNKALRLVGTRDKSGRTSKRLRTRYR